MSSVIKFHKPFTLTPNDEIIYIKQMISGEVEVFSVNYNFGLVKDQPKAGGHSLKFLIRNDDGKFKEFFNFRYDSYGPSREIYKKANRDIYNALFKLVEDIIQMPISEFTNGNFDYI